MSDKTPIVPPKPADHLTPPRPAPEPEPKPPGVPPVIITPHVDDPDTKDPFHGFIG